MMTFSQTQMERPEDWVEPNMEKFYVARLKLTSRYPFIARTVLAMPVIFTQRCPTMGVDPYWRLYINPAYMNSLSVRELIGVIYHEVLHLLLVHHDRAQALGIYSSQAVVTGQDQQGNDLQAVLNLPKIWNYAADCEINDNILAEGFDLPEGLCIADVFDLPRDLLAEQYYDLLRQQAEQDAQQFMSQLEPMYGPAGGEDGSGAGGEQQPWELDGPGSASGDQDDPTQGLSAATGEVLRQQMAQEIAEQADRDPGSVPGGLERWAKDRLNAKVDWRKALKALVRQGVALTMGAVDYYYDRPSRRQAAFPRVILPRLRAPQPNLAMIVDTSGSMSDQNLSQALAEIGAVLRAVSSPVDVISGDTGAMAVSKVLKPEQAKLVGGGGTDMGAILEALAGSKKRYGLVIVVTDGYTPWREQNPLSCPVIVVLVEPGSPNPPSWATVMRAYDA